MARLGGARSTCEECSACSMLWCSVSLQCFCDGDGACGGELLADSHMELIERNRGITSWCPDAWSSCASTEVGCQSQERTEDCGLCRAKAACSWCLYSDAVDATASMCIFNGDSGGQTRSCLDIRTVCPVVEVARTENLDSVISVAAILGACLLGSVFGTIWKEKKRRRDRRAVREAALVRAEGGGQDAHGANSMIKAQVEDRKQQLQIALSLLPSFEFGKLSLPPGGTPLDELPSFEQRQLDLSTGGVMAGSVDDKIISRSESLPLERADSKLGAVGKLRAKSLKVAEALSMSGKPPREEFSSGLDELVLCSICISGYHDDGTCSMLPCGHIFHRKCIEQWLQSGRTAGGDCPMCKEPILQGALQEEVDSALGRHVMTRPSQTSRGRARVASGREIDTWAGPTETDMDRMRADAAIDVAAGVVARQEREERAERAERERV